MYSANYTCTNTLYTLTAVIIEMTVKFLLESKFKNVLIKNQELKPKKKNLTDQKNGR